MPLNADTLKGAIISELANKQIPADSSGNDAVARLAEGIAKAVVAHVLTAVVAGTVTSGAGAGGAVTGTIS